MLTLHSSLAYQKKQTSSTINDREKGISTLHPQVDPGLFPTICNDKFYKSTTQTEAAS